MAFGRRRMIGGAALAVLSVGIWTAQAGTTAPRTSQTQNLFDRLEALCAHAQAGTYGLPGHLCNGTLSLDHMVTDESLDRLANEVQRAAVQSAPYGTSAPNAIAAALDQKARLLRKGQSPGNGNAWSVNGIGPLQVADAGYDGVNGLGLVENGGRITDFAYDDRHRRVFASSAGGGVFLSTDYGRHWQAIGDSLPTLNVGSVGYSPADGGTLVVVTGDGSFGASSLEGAGVYRSTNLGRTWTRAKGAPSDAFGFRVAVDPTNPKVVYAATGTGLFRSADAGRSFANVKLPTGPCAGKSNRTKGCLFANVVTDVAVQPAGGFSGGKGGQVIAAVGWRGGQVKNPDGTVQSPNNGIYTSANGAPGTFRKSGATGFTPQDRIGRIQFGLATGKDQDHRYVYALVQNAKAVQKGGIPQLPQVDDPAGAVATVNGRISMTYKAVGTLDGVFVSPDFGQTWVKMADGTQLPDPTTGSALSAMALGFGYGPGVQAWYNQFIKPDPTRTGPAGVPTRLLFGLEEVWENDDKGLPQNKPTHFRVIGRYFSGTSCLFLLASAPACPTNRDEALETTTTTHPDQHAVLFIPDGEGGVRLLVGNDGGAYTQRTSSAVTDDFENDKWGIGANRGMASLLPYNVARAKDGTIWMGLQDNGTAKIQDVYAKGKLVAKQRQIETLGGDGFFVGVDPDNSNRAYGEYVGGAMSGTVDGGHSWAGMSPPITGGLFSTPFSVDPLDPDHVMVGGNEIVETGSGPSTGAEEWAQVYDLGTAKHPGDARAEQTASDANNIETAVQVRGNNAYVGYCGVCDVLSDSRPFRSGIATNVGGTKPGQRYTTNGWHIAAAKGLPERYVTSVTMDPDDPRTVYVTLGSYSRRWAPPGTLSGTPDRGGNLYKSVDAGEHFVNVSGDLPQAPANWVVMRGDQLLVANDFGVFATSRSSRCGQLGSLRPCSFEVLGKGLPAAPALSMQLAPWDSNLLTVATFGRGAWTYRFGPPSKTPPVRTVVLHPARFANKLVALYGFETDAQGWVAHTTDPQGVMTWRHGAPGHNSVGSMQVIPYTDEQSASLHSPALSLPSDSTVQVSWWKVQHTEGCCDPLALDWSSDGHVWHNVSVKTNDLTEDPTAAGFLHDSVKFVAPKGRLFLRFRLTSDALVSAPAYLGVLLDDVEVRR
jgi:hypothetical protein